MTRRTGVYVRTRVFTRMCVRVLRVRVCACVVVRVCACARVWLDVPVCLFESGRLQN